MLPPSPLITPKKNTAKSRFPTGDDLMRGRPYLVIENNGDVRWIPPMVLKTVCEHDNQVSKSQQQENCPHIISAKWLLS